MFYYYLFFQFAVCGSVCLINRIYTTYHLNIFLLNCPKPYRFIQFRRCLDFLSKWAETWEPVLLTRHLLLLFYTMSCQCWRLDCSNMVFIEALRLPSPRIILGPLWFHERKIVPSQYGTAQVALCSGPHRGPIFIGSFFDSLTKLHLWVPLYQKVTMSVIDAACSTSHT